MSDLSPISTPRNKHNGAHRVKAKRKSCKNLPYSSDIARTPRADERRRALRDLMDRYGLSASEVAKLAQASNSTIGNFLLGRSAALSFDVAERLANALKISLNELVGDSVGWTTIAGQRVHLKGEIATGQLVPTYLWDADQWVGYVVPADQKYAAVSYLLRLSSQEMNEIWPQGTLLQVVKLVDFKEKLRLGHRVIVTTITSDGHSEIACREIASADGRGQCHLITRSTDPRFRGLATPLEWPIQPNRLIILPNHNQLIVRDVVIRSIRDEM